MQWTRNAVRPFPPTGDWAQEKFEEKLGAWPAIKARTKGGRTVTFVIGTDPTKGGRINATGK